LADHLPERPSKADAERDAGQVERARERPHGLLDLVDCIVQRAHTLLELGEQASSAARLLTDRVRSLFYLLELGRCVLSALDFDVDG